MSEKTRKGATATYKCRRCGEPFVARTADRKRGWARFCSKSCKAKRQEKRTGQHAAYRNRQRNALRSFDNIDPEGAGWDAHKDALA